MKNTKTTLKILAIHSAYSKNENHQSQVDHWRIARPLEELAKHTDWQIDHQPTFITGLEKFKTKEEFTAKEMEKAFKRLCEYDIIFSSYHADATAYTMLKVARDRAGTKFIMDVDDDMFSINPDNPFWVKMTDEKCYWMQCMIRDNDFISTTTPILAKVFRDRREQPDDTVFVNPNYIPKLYQHPKFDNGDKIVIGYFGGSSHYQDLHETGVAEALEKLMNENKNVYFKAIGMPLDKYVPRGRYEFVDGKRGNGWINELYPTLNLDIALGPLYDNIFNHGKSNIKWQESTRAGSLFVASNIGPYSSLKDGTAILVENTPESWYKGLKQALTDTTTLKNAQKELKNWELETQWQSYKKMFETVCSQK